MARNSGPVSAPSDFYTDIIVYSLLENFQSIYNSYEPIASQAKLRDVTSEYMWSFKYTAFTFLDKMYA